MFYLIRAAADFQGLANNTTGMLGRIGGGALIVFCGYKAIHYLAIHKMGAMVGMLLIAVIPAMFLFDPHGSSQLLTNTVHKIAH